MERVLNSEITKFLIIMGAGVVALTVILAKLITKARGSYKPYSKATILYLVAAVVFFGLIALAAHPAFLFRPLTTFILFQSYFLLLGSAHIYFMRQNLEWNGEHNA